MIHRKAYWSIALVSSLLMLPGIALPGDPIGVAVGNRVQLKATPFKYKRNTGTYYGKLTLTHRKKSKQPLYAPITLIVTGANRPGVVMANASGKTSAGLDYLDVPLPGGKLLPGRAIRNLPVWFYNPSHKRFKPRYTVYGLFSPQPAPPRVNPGDNPTPANSPPLAVPGPDKAVKTGVPVHLDGSGSIDNDHDPLRFSWSLQRQPAGSAATLPETCATTCEFTPDLPGEYLVQLIVNDGKENSLPAILMVMVTAESAACTGIVVWSEHRSLGQRGPMPFAGIHDFCNLTVDDNVDITSSGISQLVLSVQGTLFLGRNASIRVRNGFPQFYGPPAQSIAHLTADTYRVLGTDGGGFRLYPEYYGRGGNGGTGGYGENGSMENVFIGFGQYQTIYGSGGHGGGGGGGGFGGGLGGYGGAAGISRDGSVAFAGHKGFDYGADGGLGGAALPAIAGKGGGATGVGGNAERPDNNVNSGGNGGGGNGGGASAGRYLNIPYGWVSGHGGGGGGGGGYGGGILTIIAGTIRYDAAYPPKLLVSGQKGGFVYMTSRNEGQGQLGENGGGGMIVIDCLDCQVDGRLWNLDGTVSAPRSDPLTNGGNGAVTGNPAKIFVNGVEVR